MDAKLLRSFAEGALATYEARGLGLDRELALRSLETEFRDDYLELNEPSVRRRRWERCGIEGTEPDDFAERLVDLGNGRAALCGIRHLGMNLDKPFVRIWPNFPFRSTKEARSVYENQLKERFVKFNPLCIQIFTPSGSESDAAGSLLLAAKAERYLDREMWAGEERLSLLDSEVDDCFDWYQEMYDTFHKEFPKLKDRVTSNNRELMEDCREQGLLRVAEIEGRRVGLIAAERERFLGHKGIYFVEILLDRPWRGQGLAKALQRKFVVECCGADDVIWGAIESMNTASLKTALANGRRVVRGECFLLLSKS